MKKIIAANLLLAVIAAAPLAAFGQGRAADWPNKPVKFLVPFTAGGSTDSTARVIGASFEKLTGQPFLVENQPGGGQMIAVANIHRAPADGYTLLFGVDSLIYESILNKEVTQKPAELTPISMIGGAGLIYSVHPSVPAKDFREFVAYAKANPGKINEGIVSTGIDQLRDLWQGLGVSMLQVGYKGGAQTTTALLAGEVQIYGASPLDVLENSKAGKVRPLVYSGTSRHPQFPDTPTFKESVGADQNYRFAFAIWGPPKMAADLTTKINGAVRDVLKTSEASQRIASLGLQNLAGSPDDMRRDLDSITRKVQGLLDRGFKLR